MDLRQLTPDLSVAPQINPEDMARLAAEGYVAVIDNRPDDEVPPSHQSPAMAEAAAAAGLQFHYLPIVPGQLTPDLAALVGRALATTRGRALAYCRSGTRSTTAWALDQAGQQPADDILRAAAAAGYDLSGMRPLLDR